ncbi:N-acetylglucosamine-6-phosphate deacetylase [Avibacterium avium]|uniref:N-acetylglucosamine-6-phosphate deacetylase n=1 Tax=Avibacterium avium TaxID=751 RepID=UPI003BF8A89B
MRYAIKPEKVMTSSGELLNKYVVINQGKIESIQEEKPVDCDVHYYPDSYLSAGFIDVHIHGRAGADVMDENDTALATIAQALPQTGVIAWVGTTVSAPWQNILSSMQRMKDYIQQGKQSGAELLGSFMEGPYFTERHRGSHPTEYLMPPTIPQLEELLQISDRTLLRVAIAPEIENAEPAIKWLVENGVKVSVAHTNATFEQVTKAYYLGADCGVHLFNGMSALHHREPGCTGAVLYHDMLAEIIADGIHVHPAVLNLAYKLKTYRKMVLITDCMRAGGLPDGEYTLGVQTVRVENGQARTFDGSLAGSTCSLDQALRNMVFKADVPVWEAIQMVTTIPATYLGVADRIGDIAVGKEANFTLLNKELQVQATYIQGEQVYKCGEKF